MRKRIAVISAIGLVIVALIAYSQLGNQPLGFKINSNNYKHQVEVIDSKVIEDLRFLSLEVKGSKDLKISDFTSTIKFPARSGDVPFNIFIDGKVAKMNDGFTVTYIFPDDYLKMSPFLLEDQTPYFHMIYTWDDDMHMEETYPLYHFIER